MALPRRGENDSAGPDRDGIGLVCGEFARPRIRSVGEVRPDDNAVDHRAVELRGRWSDATLHVCQTGAGWWIEGRRRRNLLLDRSCTGRRYRLLLAERGEGEGPLGKADRAVVAVNESDRLEDGR